MCGTQPLFLSQGDHWIRSESSSRWCISSEYPKVSGNVVFSSGGKSNHNNIDETSKQTARFLLADHEKNGPLCITRGNPAVGALQLISRMCGGAQPHLLLFRPYLLGR